MKDLLYHAAYDYKRAELKKDQLLDYRCGVYDGLMKAAREVMRYDEIEETVENAFETAEKELAM